MPKTHPFILSVPVYPTLTHNPDQVDHWFNHGSSVNTRVQIFFGAFDLQTHLTVKSEHRLLAPSAICQKDNLSVEVAVASGSVGEGGPSAEPTAV